jgi:flagellar biosynthesis protein FliR
MQLGGYDLRLLSCMMKLACIWLQDATASLSAAIGWAMAEAAATLSGSHQRLLTRVIT